MSVSRPSLALCMIVRNEESNLPHSLGEIHRLFDEVIVVDTGSTDNTRSLAADYGARVIEIVWPDDFAAARNVSLQAATADWIIWLDGDNHLPPSGVDILRRLLDQERQAVIWCTEIIVGNRERLLQKRVFPRRPEVYFSGRVHEQLIHPPDYRSIMSPVEILHWGYEDKAAAREKGRRNLRLLEKMALSQPHDLYLCYQMGRTLLNLRRFDQAWAWLEKAAASPDGNRTNRNLFRHAHVLLAQALDRLNRPLQAMETLKDLIGQAPDYGPAYYYLGRKFYLSEDYAAAAELLADFLKIGVNDPVSGLNPTQMRFTAALMLGRSLAGTGRRQESKEAFLVSSRLDPRHPEPFIALAEMALSDGQRDEARQYLNSCLEIAPFNRKALGLAREVVAHAP